MKRSSAPKGGMEKLVKGIIIGGAIGSVVGLGMAPKNQKKGTTDPTNTSKTPQKKSPKKGTISSIGRGLKILITGKK